MLPSTKPTTERLTEFCFLSFISSDHFAAWGSCSVTRPQVQPASFQSQYFHLPDPPGNCPSDQTNKRRVAGKDYGQLLRLRNCLGVSLSAGLITSTRGWIAMTVSASSMEAIRHLFPELALKPWSLRVSMERLVCSMSFLSTVDGSYNSFLTYRLHRIYSCTSAKL